MQVYADKKPSVSSTTWKGIWHEKDVKVYEADRYYDFYKIIAGSDRPKYFFGETAWMDTQRYVVDKIGFSGYNIFN